MYHKPILTVNNQFVIKSISLWNRKMFKINDLSKYPEPNDFIDYGDESENAAFINGRIVNNGYIEFFVGDDVTNVTMALLPSQAKHLADKIYEILKEFSDN
jgi:hypothetical protein